MALHDWGREEVYPRPRLRSRLKALQTNTPRTGPVMPLLFAVIKKIVSKSGKFSSRENVVTKHHIYHAIHHDLTTKTPQRARGFSQNPLQKPHFTTPKKS
jgi:hypothetical protein